MTEHISAEAVRALIEGGVTVHLIDVRPPQYVADSKEIAAGAVLRDPARISEWMNELPEDALVVTICAFGSRIGPETAATLRAAGLDARYMTEGHAGWKAIGGPVRKIE